MRRPEAFHGVALAIVVAILGALAVPAAATPPGKNGMIVWQRESLNGPARLWVANPDGTGARSVFANPKYADVEGTFSTANPNVVFFTRLTRAAFSQDIYTGNLATGAVTRVTRANSADDAATVSPDGTKIAYFAVKRPRNPDDPDVQPPSRIHVANLDGSGDRAITPAGKRSFDPDWSPDGSQIVYMESRPDGNRLAIVNADGTGRRPLTKFGGVGEINAKWMPDGKSIVFEQLRETGNRSDIATISPAGGTPHKILATRAWETNPIPSPDGTRILFTSDRDRPGRDRLGPGTEVYTMAVDGTDIVRLTNNRAPDIFPDWQHLP